MDIKSIKARFYVEDSPVETLGCQRRCPSCSKSQSKKFGDEWDGDIIHEGYCIFAKIIAENERLRKGIESIARLPVSYVREMAMAVLNGDKAPVGHSVDFNKKGD